MTLRITTAAFVFLLRHVRAGRRGEPRPDRTGRNLMNRDPTQTSSTLGAGGLLSSVHDMKWDAALYGNALLSDAAKQLMWATTVLPNGTDTGYGFTYGPRTR